MTSEARALLIELFAVLGGGMETADRLIDAYEKEAILTKEEATEIRKKIKEVGVPPPFGVLDFPGSGAEKRRKARELETYIKKVCRQRPPRPLENT